MQTPPQIPTAILLKARDRYLRNAHKVSLYSYQRELSDLLITALNEGTPREIAFGIARQSGKTTALVHTVEFLLQYWNPVFELGQLSICMFAPQLGQISTNMRRLKGAILDAGLGQPLELNSRTLAMPDGSEVYSFPMADTSKPESKTSNMNIYEEAQDIDEFNRQLRADPMLAATNGPKVFVGTSGTQTNYFWKLMQTGVAYKYDYQKVIASKRAMYEQTGDERHLAYERFIAGEIEKYGGTDADGFRAPYKLEWLIESGQFTTREQLESLYRSTELIEQEREHPCYVGIDTAKHPDSTWVTVVRAPKGKPKDLCNWLVLHGDNYEDQFDAIVAFLTHYNVKAIAIDSTGQADFMADKFARNTKWRNEQSGLYAVKFSLVSKDAMYKNLKVVLENALTTIPAATAPRAPEFARQMLELQRKYVGELMRVHHPDHDPDAHDDAPDSWALAEWAYRQSQLNPAPKVSVRSVSSDATNPLAW